MTGKRLFFMMVLSFLVSIGIAIYDQYHNGNVDVQNRSASLPVKEKTQDAVAKSVGHVLP